MIEEKPEFLIGYGAYGSEKLDEELIDEGSKMVAPDKKNRKKPKTQDGHEFRRYKRRWIVERFFAWMKKQASITEPMGILSREFSRIYTDFCGFFAVETILR